jgi:hypothetical protein
LDQDSNLCRTLFAVAEEVSKKPVDLASRGRNWFDLATGQTPHPGVRNHPGANRAQGRKHVRRNLISEFTKKEEGPRHANGVTRPTRVTVNAYFSKATAGKMG